MLGHSRKSQGHNGSWTDRVGRKIKFCVVHVGGLDDSFHILRSGEHASPFPHSQVVLLLGASVDRGVVLGGRGSTGLLLLVTTLGGKSNADGSEDGAEGTVVSLGNRYSSCLSRWVG